MMSYRYSVFHERRIHLMIGCTLYCILEIVYHVDYSDSNKKLYLLVFICFIHYQILAYTFIYYFQKIMKILPQIASKWTCILNTAHYTQSLILFAFSVFIISDVAINSYQGLVNCEVNEVTGFQFIILLTFISYAIVLHQLKRKINSVQKVDNESGLDRKINFQY